MVGQIGGSQLCDERPQSRDLWGPEARIAAETMDEHNTFGRVSQDRSRHLLRSVPGGLGESPGKVRKVLSRLRWWFPPADAGSSHAQGWRQGRIGPGIW